MRPALARIGLCVLLLNCAEATEEPAEEGAPAADTVSMAADSATAVVRDSAGRTLGTLTLRGTDSGVEITGTLSGLPAGEHGFHIHQTGSCEPPSFESAGSHLATPGSGHGFDAPRGPHPGDLRNLEVGPEGTVEVDQTNGRLVLREGEAALLDADGAAVVIHSDPDDYVTQPSGGSGDRIACGVVGG